MSVASRRPRSLACGARVAPCVLALLAPRAAQSVAALPASSAALGSGARLTIFSSRRYRAGRRAAASGRRPGRARGGACRRRGHAGAAWGRQGAADRGRHAGGVRWCRVLRAPGVRVCAPAADGQGGSVHGGAGGARPLRAACWCTCGWMTGGPSTRCWSAAATPSRSPFAPDDDYADAFVRLGRRARERGAGLWSSEACQGGCRRRSRGLAERAGSCAGWGLTRTAPGGRMKCRDANPSAKSEATRCRARRAAPRTSV